MADPAGAEKTRIADNPKPRYTKDLEYQRGILFARLYPDILIKNKLAAGRHIDLHGLDRMFPFKGFTR